MVEDNQYMERIDMDNDYEGGVEIGGEFFYRSVPPPLGPKITVIS